MPIETALFGPQGILFSSALDYILGRRRDWPEAVEMTPEMQVEQLYDYLQQTEGRIPEGGTEGRGAMWGGLFERAQELGMDDLVNQLVQRPEVANQFSGNPIQAGKSIVDDLLKEIQDFAPFWDQAQVVLNPVTGQSTIVFGTPPAGSPVVQVGNLPRSNTNVGVTTGIPIIDQAINSVLKKPGGLDVGSIKDEVIRVISEQAGLDPVATAAIMGEDLDTILSTSNAVLADKASRLGVDLSGPKEEDNVIRETAGAPPDVVEDVIRETAGAPPDVIETVPTREITVDPGSLISTRGVTVDPGSLISTRGVTVDPDSLISTRGVTVDLGLPTPSELGVDSPENVVDGETSGTPGTPGQSPYGQGIRGVATEKAGLAQIEDPFNVRDMSLANILMRLSGESNNARRASYYGGGAVENAMRIDEIIRLLRG